MIEEFDKEIDALLRQAAQSETAVAGNNQQPSIGNPHLDADEISLFAENALPKKMRENAVAHFADCDRCRKILSDLISQNPASEIVSAKQVEVFVSVIPWYRKLFAFPSLAYTMGALVLVFSGFVAFTVLQSVDNSKNSEVAQVSERPIGGQGISSDGDSVTVEKQSSGAMMSNSMSNASSMSNSTATSSSNAMMSNASPKSAAQNSKASSVSNSPTITNKSIVSANDSPKDKPRSEDEITQKAVTELPLNGRMAKSLLEQKQERDKKDDKNDAAATDATKSPASQPKPEQLAVTGNRMMADTSSARARKNSRTNTETTSVGGKTFQRQNNSWVDSAYKNQSTTNITRGTNEFNKLDSGLRVIAGNLGGTVIVVWKDKAYRIQ